MRRSQNFGLLKWQNPRTPVETENQKTQNQILKRPLRTLFVHQSESNFLVSTGVRGFCLQQFRNFGDAHFDMHPLYYLQQSGQRFALVFDLFLQSRIRIDFLHKKLLFFGTVNG